MKKYVQIAAFAFAVCLCAVSATSCDISDKKSNSVSIEDLTAEDLDEALNKLDDEYAAAGLEEEDNVITEAVTEPEKIVYEPCEEIKNASLNSGYVQIGNTVFRNGGYYTVADFVSKYSDKYDLSEIHLDEYLSVPNWSATITSLEDPTLTASVIYGQPDDTQIRTKVSECIVSTIETYDKSCCFFPTGIQALDYDAIMSLINKFKSENSAQCEYKESSDNIYAAFLGEETNLYGRTPSYTYQFYFDSWTLKGNYINFIPYNQPIL